MVLKKKKKKGVDLSTIKIKNKREATPYEAGEEVALPDAGHARREELKRREDELVEAAEQLSEYLIGGGDVDLKNLPIINEIARHFTNGVLDVSGAKNDRAYKWVPFGHPKDNPWQQVNLAQSEGWRMVSGNMPEAREKKDENGYRRAGDVLLMWMPMRLYEAIETIRAAEEVQKDAAAKGASELTNAANNMNKARGRKVAIPHLSREEGDNPLFETLKAKADRMLARKLAGDQFTQKLKDGTVPGVKPGQSIRELVGRNN